MSWAWMKDSNHFSGLPSAFRAAYEQSNLKVGLISAFHRHTNLKVGLISAFHRHTSINRSISADHALAHAPEFGGEWRNLKKVSSFHYLTMYLNSFVPKTKHNCGCISQVCIYNGIFQFLECFMWLAWRQMLDCIIMFSAQDQYCPYGVLQFPSGSKTTPSGGKSSQKWGKTNPSGLKTFPSGDKTNPSGDK